MTEGPTGARTPAPAEAPPEVQQASRFSISEDWAATLFGLILLGLVLAGVITGELIGSFVPTLVEVAA
jgi:hypothetical protein